MRNDSTLEEVAQYYYYELRGLLLKLNANMETFPTLHAFQGLIMKKYFFGNLLTKIIYQKNSHALSLPAFISSFITFPIVITEDADTNFPNFMSTEDRAMQFKRRLFQNPRFKSIAKSVLALLDRKGLLDDL